MLSQESDKSLPEVAKGIKKVLFPSADLGTSEADDDEKPIDLLPLNILTASIEKVAERINYGIDTVASSSTSEVALPAGLQMWRWEMRNLDLAATENRDKIASRREERQRAKAEAVELLNGLTEEERGVLFSKGRKVKATPHKTSEVLGEGAAVSARTGDKAVVPSATSNSVVQATDHDDVFSTPSKHKRVYSGHTDDVAKETCSASVSPSKSSSSRDSPEKKAKTSPEQEARAADREEKRKAREAKKAEKAKKEADKEEKKRRELQVCCVLEWMCWIVLSYL